MLGNWEGIFDVQKKIHKKTLPTSKLLADIFYTHHSKQIQTLWQLRIVERGQVTFSGAILAFLMAYLFCSYEMGAP